MQVDGVKGPSVLSSHPRFNLVKGTVIDALHCICLGVTRKLLTIWLDKKRNNEAYYLGSKVIVEQCK